MIGFQIPNTIDIVIYCNIWALKPYYLVLGPIGRCLVRVACALFHVILSLISALPDTELFQNRRTKSKEY